MRIGQFPIEYESKCYVMKIAKLVYDISKLILVSFLIGNPPNVLKVHFYSLKELKNRHVKMKILLCVFKDPKEIHF